MESYTKRYLVEAHFSVGFSNSAQRRKNEKRNPSRIAQITHKQEQYFIVSHWTKGILTVCLVAMSIGHNRQLQKP
jgi:hypothetical protein